MASTPETNPTEEQAPASAADDVPSAEPAEVEVASAPADSQPPDVAGGPPPPPPSALKPKLSQRVAEPTEEGNEEAGEYGEAAGDYYEEGAEGEGAGYEGEEGAEGGEGGEGGEGEAGGEGEEDEEEDEEEEEDEATMRFYSERRYLGGGSIDGEKSIWASCYAQEANPFGKFEAEEAQTVEVEERVHLPLDGFGDSLLAKYEAVQEGSTHARSLLFHLQKGRARSDGRSVAFKVHGRSLDEQFSAEQSARESEQLRGLQHPGLVTLLDFYAAPDGQTAVFVTEALEGHDLFGQLLSLYGGEDEGPTEGQLRAVVRELVATVAYLHSQNIVHRDITTDVLYFPAVGSLEHLKVVDLHNAASADDAASDWPVNPLFQPPESIARQPCTFPVDVWAVGVLTFFLLCGHPPFHDANKLKLKIKIKQGQFELHPSVSAAAADFVSQCLRTDPSARPKAADLLNHPWLAASASASSSSSSATETKLSHVPVNLRKSVALP